MSTNTIQVTACDNELVLVAIQGNNSYVLCNIESGYSYPVDVTLNLIAGAFTQTQTFNGTGGPLIVSSNVYLPSGGYSLLLLGINWGGAYQFTVTVNGVTYQAPPSSSGVELVWSPAAINFTI